MKHISKITIALFIATSLFFFTACENEAEHHDLSSTDITLVINSPHDTQQFDAGDTVKIIATIDAPTEMHGYEVHLTRLADSTEVISKDYDLHSSHFDVSETYINEGLVHSDMELEVVAIIDHTGKKTSKKVHFHCHEK